MNWMNISVVDTAVSATLGIAKERYVVRVFLLNLHVSTMKLRISGFVKVKSVFHDMLISAFDVIEHGITSLIKTFMWREKFNQFKV